MGFFNLKNKIHNAQKKLSRLNPITSVQDQLDGYYKKGFNLDEEGKKLIEQIRKDHDIEFEKIKEEANVKFRELNLKSAKSELETIRKHMV